MTKARVCGRCGELVFGECPCRVEQAKVRPNASARGYDAKWRAFRKRVWNHLIKTTGEIPPCAYCKKPIREQAHFDHITPVQSAADPLFYEITNIQVLHPSCHAEKTADDVRKGLTRR